MWVQLYLWISNQFISQRQTKINDLNSDCVRSSKIVLNGAIPLQIVIFEPKKKNKIYQFSSSQVETTTDLPSSEFVRFWHCIKWTDEILRPNKCNSNAISLVLCDCQQINRIVTNLVQNPLLQRWKLCAVMIQTGFKKLMEIIWLRDKDRLRSRQKNSVGYSCVRGV